MEKYSIEKGTTPANGKEKVGPEKNTRGPMFLSNAYGKVRSRYLGAPIGSCHDLCKYGHKHELDDDGKHAIFRRFMSNVIASDAVQNHVRGLNTCDMKKSSGLKFKVSDKIKHLHQNMQPKRKEVGNSVEISIKVPSEDDNMADLLLLENIGLSKNSTTVDEVNHVKTLNSKKKKEAVRPKALPVPEPFLVKQNILTQMNSSASAEIASGSGPNIFKEKVASYMKETVTSSALKLNSQKKMTVRKPSTSSRFLSAKINAYPPSEKIDGYVKPSISLKARVPLVRPTTQLNATTRNLNGARIFDRKVSKSFKILEVGDRNFLKLQKASTYSTTPADVVVSLKTRKFINLKHTTRERGIKPDDDVNIQGDIQEIIETKTKKEDMDNINENCSKEGDGYTSEACVSDVSALSEIEDIKRKQNCKLSEKGMKRRVRRTPSVQLDDKSSPFKMKFKRGRVMELRPMENIGPRRLRFRRGRVLDDNSNAEGMKRTFRRRDMGDTKAPGAVTHANSSEASTVMLKHQNAQEKKDIQALFNHVIEETANKLVKSRKSKVKALVGAFETVISLQDTKASQLV